MVRTATERWKLRAGNPLNRTARSRSCSSGRKARGGPFPVLPRHKTPPECPAWSRGGPSWRPVRGPAGAVSLAAPPVFQLPFTAVSPGSRVLWVRPCRPAGRRRSASALGRRPFPARTRSQPARLPAPFRRAWPVPPSSPYWNRALRGRQARTGRAGGVSPRGLSPAGGASADPCLDTFPGACRDVPASLSEARTGVLPPSRWGFGRPGALRGRQACTGRAGGVSPRGLSPAGGAAPTPAWIPSRAPAGMSLLRSQRRVQAFCRPPGGVFDVRERCRAVRPAQGAQGCFSPGSPLPVAPRRSLPNRLLGPAWDIPVLLSEPSTRFLPASRWGFDVREVCGAVRPAQAAAQGVFLPGLSPARGAAPVPS